MTTSNVVSDPTASNGDGAVVPAAIAGVDAVRGVAHAAPRANASQGMIRFIRSTYAAVARTRAPEMTNPSGAACRCLRGLSSLAGFQSLGSTPRHAWPIDFPFPSRIGPTWCSGILQSDSCGQRPHNRCVDVEPSTHIASTPSRRRLSNRGFDRLRDWESIVQSFSESVNRETFPKIVTVINGCVAPRRRSAYVARHDVAHTA